MSRRSWVDNVIRHHHSATTISICATLYSRLGLYNKQALESGHNLYSLQKESKEEGKKRIWHGYLYVFSDVAAAHRCVWISCRRTSSCRRKASLLSASAGELAGEMSSRTPSHSLLYDIHAASSSPCWHPYSTKHAHNVIKKEVPYTYYTQSFSILSIHKKC